MISFLVFDHMRMGNISTFLHFEFSFFFFTLFMHQTQIYWYNFSSFYGIVVMISTLCHCKIIIGFLFYCNLLECDFWKPLFHAYKKDVQKLCARTKVCKHFLGLRLSLLGVDVFAPWLKHTICAFFCVHEIRERLFGG